MNKKILAAAALALVSGVAMADASLYGIADISVANVNNAGNGTQTTNALADGVWLPSLFGIKGGEDMGNGMKAHFQLESNLSMANGTAGDASVPGSGTTKLFDRFATVGVSGNFGDVTAGEMLDPLFLQSFLNGVRLAHSGSLAVAGQVQFGSSSGNNGSTVANFFESNWLTYKSPTFNNLTVSGGYQFGNAAGSNANGAGEYVMVNYAANGLAADAAYESQNDSANTNKLKKIQLGANYTMGDLKLAGQMNSFKSDNSVTNSGTVIGHVNADGYEVGASYNLRPNLTGFANYYWINENGYTTNYRPTVLSLAMKYSLSKRTSVWAMANRATDGANALYTGTNSNIGNGTTTNGSQNGVALGMTHTF